LYVTDVAVVWDELVVHATLVRLEPELAEGIAGTTTSAMIVKRIAMANSALRGQLLARPFWSWRRRRPCRLWSFIFTLLPDSTQFIYWG
jgi:hypothetical protein